MGASVFSEYTHSELLASEPRVPVCFFMNKPQLWRLIGKDVASQFQAVSAGVPVTSIRLVNIITLALMVSGVGGVSVSKSSVVLVPCLQNTAATVCLPQRTLFQPSTTRTKVIPVRTQPHCTEVWSYKYCEGCLQTVFNRFNRKLFQAQFYLWRGLEQHLVHSQEIQNRIVPLEV